MVKNPVLFITFANPRYARRAFDAIKKAKPKVLYFYSNKARSDRPDEIKRNETVRNFVKEIDWDCDLHTWFRDEYVEIYTSLWSAMDWFFDNVEQGMVLEEDCVATQAFFPYCDTMLERYKDEPKIGIITADNYAPQFNPEGCDYFFSHQTHIYGWANWADRWKSLDRKMSKWPTVKKRALRKYSSSIFDYLWGRVFMGYVYKTLIKSLGPWDYIMCYNNVANIRCCIIPKYNLVYDIGLTGEHHKGSRGKEEVDVIVPELAPFSLDNHPNIIEPNKRYDKKLFWTHTFVSGLKYFSKRFFQKLFGK